MHPQMGAQINGLHRKLSVCKESETIFLLSWTWTAFFRLHHIRVASGLFKSCGIILPLLASPALYTET